jgi:hypothetical protein
MIIRVLHMNPVAPSEYLITQIATFPNAVTLCSSRLCSSLITYV